MKKTKGIYLRADGRWEARYKKAIREDGKVIYGSVYGASEQEVREKRAAITGNDEETHARERRLNLLILGAGSHGRNVMEIAESLRVFSKISFVDDKATGPNILGKCRDSADLILDYPCAVIAIWDIFIGNMSVVGPRPGLWNQDLLTGERDKYHVNDIKPGLTGWAQIHGRDCLEIPDKVKADGKYAAEIGLKMDLKCFFGSFLVFVKDDGVVEGGTGEISKSTELHII